MINQNRNQSTKAQHLDSNKLKKYYHIKINYNYFFLFKNTIMIYFLFIILFACPIISQNNRNLQFTGSEITIKINGTGIQPIIYESFYKMPDKIYCNEIEVQRIDNNKIIIQNDLSKIKLIWNDKLTRCYNMFVSLINIIEVDLSNFDFDVSNMAL